MRERRSLFGDIVCVIYINRKCLIGRNVIFYRTTYFKIKMCRFPGLYQYLHQRPLQSMGVHNLEMHVLTCTFTYLKLNNIIMTFEYKKDQI